MLDVQNKIAILKKHPYSEPKQILDDKSARHYLQNFHDKFVITNAEFFESKQTTIVQLFVKLFTLSVYSKSSAFVKSWKAKQKSPTALTNGSSQNQAQLWTGMQNIWKIIKLLLLSLKNHFLFCIGFQNCTKTRQNKDTLLLRIHVLQNRCTTEIGLSTIQLKFWTKSPGATNSKKLKHPIMWFFNPIHFDST